MEGGYYSINYIQLSGPVISTQGNITLIDTNNPSVVTAAIADSNVLDQGTTISTSPEPVAVVFSEMERYLASNRNTRGYRIVEPGKSLEW